MASSTTAICQFAQSPPLNTDIAGIGVRISTYVQSMLTVIIITVSHELGDIYAQCFPFVIMNISVLIAALALGFASNPQISLQDGLIAWLFTFIPLFVFALGTGMIQTRKKLKAIKTSSWDRVEMEWSPHIMLILHAGYTLSLLRNYANFGKTPECNNAARIFFFGTHRVTNTWFIGWTIAYAVSLILIYTLLMKTIISMRLRRTKSAEGLEEKKMAEVEDVNGSKYTMTTSRASASSILPNYLWGISTFLVLIIWIAFTELTVVKNDFAPSDSPAWQFGQIFPMILLTVPVLATARAVAESVQHNGKRTKSKMAKDEEYPLSDLPTKVDSSSESQKGSTEVTSRTVEAIEVL